MRIVFVNLHGNEMLVKTMNKFVFKQSVAIKHKYLLDYLLSHPDEYEVCSYINPKGFSMANSLPRPIMSFVNLFRFMEHRIVMRKNGIPFNAIKVIKRISDIKESDIVIMYRHTINELYQAERISAHKFTSMIHFSGSQEESVIMRNSEVGILFGEADLTKYSDMFKRYYSWYDKEFIVHPFVFQPRFKVTKPFSERKNMAFATGTITYKDYPEFIKVYGNPCDQPARKQIKDNPELLKDLVYCTSSDYSEDAKTTKNFSKNSLVRFYQTLHYKMFESQQKKYYSFDMVESFNNYKMCIVGEEILGIPGIGFVEGMACGCAYIGQKKGYYEDYGMIEGVHYIGYDGTLNDLISKITYYQQPENQDKLEEIATNGYNFVIENFNGSVASKNLIKRLEGSII